MTARVRRCGIAPFGSADETGMSGRTPYSRAVRLPKLFDPEGGTQMEITRSGDTLILRPVRPSWDSFWERPPLEEADDFLAERPEVIESGRFDLTDDDLEGRSE